MSLYFFGLLALFASPTCLLLGRRADRGQRLSTSVLLVGALTLSVFLASPLLFTGYDELLHQASLWQWGAHPGVLAHNSLLPISPRYPGLEGFTLGVKWVTGLPLVPCEMIVILVSRGMLVLALFLLVERITGSARAAGTGVVVYAASPQFYMFNAAYAYQTLALGLGAGCIYLLLWAVDQKSAPTGGVRSSRRGLLLLSIGACLATVITHHLVGWLTVGLLVLWASALAWSRRWPTAGLVGVVAGVGLLAVAAWTFINGPLLFHYLRPILSGPAHAIVGLAEGQRRKLFQGAGTYTTPVWERVVMLIAATVVLTTTVVAVRALLSGKTTLRGRGLRWIPILVALGYPIVLLSRLEADSQEVGARASTFVFFGTAIVVGAWYAGTTRRLWRPAVIGAATVCFLGGLLLGSGPDWLYVPGPYAGPSADQRSIDSASVAAARWAASTLPADSTIAADRDNAAIMAAVGHLVPESEASGGLNVGPLYFAPRWSPADTAAVRRAHIRYLLVDQRLATGPPVFSAYFAPGETTGTDRLTVGELAKFGAIPGMQRIYDNGPIQIYDLAGLLGLSPRQARAGSPMTWPHKTDWPLLVSAALAAGILIGRWRSRPAEQVLFRLMAASLAVMAGALGIFFLPVSSYSWTRLIVISLYLLSCVLAAARRILVHWRDSATVAGGAHRFRTGMRFSEVRLHPALVSLGAVAAAGCAIAIAVQSEASAWRAPTTLALDEIDSGITRVEVHLTDGSQPTRLVFRIGSDTAQWHLPAGRSSWSIRLPTESGVSPTEGRRGTINLVEDGRTVRDVSVTEQ